MKFLFYTTIVLVLMASGCGAASRKNEVCTPSGCVEVTLARDEATRLKGLMNVERLPEKEGMLFIFPSSSRQGFWMKNTLIPLDIIWIDQDRRVTDISVNTPPCENDPCPVYYPKEKALYVLEINAQHAQKFKILPGEKLEFRLSDIH